MRIIFKDGSILDAQNIERIDFNSESKQKDECQEADEYVRDHLLLEWAMHTPYFIVGDPDSTTIEVLYDSWINWLKGKEAENAQRSKI